MTSSCHPAGPYIPIKIEESNLNSGIIDLLQVLRPDWKSKNIKWKLFTDGITNKLVGCYINELNHTNTVLIRIYGNKTDLLIDRKAEIRNINLLHKLGLAPQLYGIFENGLAYQFYPGDTLNPESVINDKVWPLVARNMAKMHKVELGEEVPKQPFIWDKTEQFLNLLPATFNEEVKQTRFVKSFGSVTKLKIEFERLKSHLIETPSPIVFAHNDLLLGNVIYNKEAESIYFIDYEYATYNYQGFDIANHFNEFVGLSIEDIDYNRYPNKEFQINWIREYLKEFLDTLEPRMEDVNKLYAEVQLLALISHFFWGVWSLVQFEHSNIDFDFLRYAEIRLNRYHSLKDQVYKEFHDYMSHA